jgi:hypothetical protein
MKSLARLITALSLAGSCFAGVALAQNEGGADGASGAKGLFFEQLSHPSDNLNTGIQYWIELHHDGQIIHATNKTAFHTGDKIRFHIRPNIDGFAYIMLKSGSRGEQAVLFPSKGRDENNKITHGKEIVLPDDGMLSFDANPGTEKLTLLVSRKPIDTESYLSATTASLEAPPDTSSKGSTEASSKEPQVAVAEAPRLVAMASSGSKDLIPNQVLVAYLPSSSGAPDSVKAAAAAAKASKQNALTSSKQQEASNQKTSSGSSSSSSNANLNLSPSSSSSKVSSKTSSKTKSGSSSSSSARVASSTSAADDSKPKTSGGSHKGNANKGSKHQSEAIANTHGTPSRTQSEKGTLNAGLVTVVFKNPDSVLAADISLEHL